MTLVDTSGWVEIFTDGVLASKYLPLIENKEKVVTPTIVLYEVYKKLRRDASEEAADMAVAQLQETVVVPLSKELAIHAAEVSLQYSLPMADAIVYATALSKNATLATSDKDFEGLPKVKYIKK